jgi:hypothetical protein
MLKRVVLVVLGSILLIVIATGVAARVREGRVSSVKVGMSRADVERILGPGRSTSATPVCPTCPATRTQFEYEGNPSLLYGHLADRFVVCYVDDVVCGMTRVGL